MVSGVWKGGYRRALLDGSLFFQLTICGYCTQVLIGGRAGTDPWKEENGEGSETTRTLSCSSHENHGLQDAAEWSME